MLTEATIRSAKPKEKPYKLFDERGLLMIVRPNGAKWWRLNYIVRGASGRGRAGTTSRAKTLSLGIYPDVPLKRARAKRDEARRLLADGMDPSIHRAAERNAGANTFGSVALEWLAKKKLELDPKSYILHERWFNKRVLPAIGSRPITQVAAPEVLAMLRRIEASGRHETARRVRAVCGRVFRYGIATGRCERDICADLKGALTNGPKRNFAAITDPIEIGKLLRAIDGYGGHATTEAALKLAPLVFVRPGELRKSEWSEFDLETAVWRIPSKRMKMREIHIVPLSTQAIEILLLLKPLTGGGKYLFPAVTSANRCMSDNTLNSALRRLGYTKEQMTGHGFRTMASTALNEQGWHPDLIELQLAHQERNKIRAAYNRAQRLAERRTMMQAWADYLDGLRNGACAIVSTKDA